MTTGCGAATLGGVPAVWRSGLGVTASGALVYVTGPSLEITQLAALLVRAGCVRAMTLDMNPDWTVFATYKPPGAQWLGGAWKRSSSAARDGPGSVHVLRGLVGP